MARQYSTRVVLNRKTLDEVSLGVADGLLAMADAVIAGARVPDDPAIGEGLIQTGATVAYANGHKVGGKATGPRRVSRQGIAVFGGFGFPGRFNELGTVHQPARPFLTPSLMAEVPGSAEFVRPAVARRLAGVK